MNYLKYRIPYDLINQKIKEGGYLYLIIQVDLYAIARGFYNRDVILSELNNYIENKQLPTLLITELKEFLNKLYNGYKRFNPKFIIFYDVGYHKQNISVSSSYKSNRTNSSKTYFQTDEEKELFYKIKNYYFEEIYKKFNISNLCKVIFLEDYESDFVPYWFIKKYEVARLDKTLNIILSVDKDLLQCCQFKNTFQAISVYIKSERRIESMLYDDQNAVSFILKSFKPDGIITSKYIPLLLAIAGDKNDGIPGIKKGLGIANAIKLIKLYNLPSDFNSTMNLPNDIKDYRVKLQTNLDLISFERQISRMPDKILSEI